MEFSEITRLLLFASVGGGAVALLSLSAAADAFLSQPAANIGHLAIYLSRHYTQS